MGFEGRQLTFNPCKGENIDMEDIDSNQAKECIYCKWKIAEGTKFCPECGKPQDWVATSSLTQKKRLMFKGHGLNQIQKIILAPLIPVLMFFITYKIALEIDYSFRVEEANRNIWARHDQARNLRSQDFDYLIKQYDAGLIKEFPEPPEVESPHFLSADPFYYNTTWLVWFGAIILTGFIELLLFRSRKNVLS